MRFSFSKNLNDYYHEFHGIGNFLYDHNHDHTHEFETISHSIQGMLLIQLDEISDFSSKTHYFA